jgi:hypothetical protein
LLPAETDLPGEIKESVGAELENEFGISVGECGELRRGTERRLRNGKFVGGQQNVEEEEI